MQEEKFAKSICSVVRLLFYASLLIVVAACSGPKEEDASRRPIKATSRTSQGSRSIVTPSSPAKKEQARQVTLPSNPGPAAKLVESFFRDWKAGLYDVMHQKTTDGPNLAEFRAGMRQTPVRWENLQVLDESSSGDDCYVTLSVEVTDLPTVMGCFVFNHSPRYGFDKLVTSENPFPAKPLPLLIETFRRVRQVWHLVKSGDGLKIQIAQQEKDSRCKDKLMKYVLDAGTKTYVSRDSVDMIKLHMARIIVQLSVSLGMTEQEISDLMPHIVWKIELAMKHAEEILDPHRELKMRAREHAEEIQRRMDKSRGLIP